MDVEDEVRDTAVRVGDLAESVRRAVGDKSLRRGPVVARKEDELRGGTVIYGKRWKPCT